MRNTRREIENNRKKKDAFFRKGIIVVLMVVCCRMAPFPNKTLFISIARTSPDIDWGFTLVEDDIPRIGQSIVVQNVSTSSPAYESGLFTGDILIGIDNSPITGRPLTLRTAIGLIAKSRLAIELQILRFLDKSQIFKRNIMFKVNSPDTSRPSSSLSSHTGRIPSVAIQDSGVRLPDNNVQQFKNEKAREQWAITKQTYRSTPLIEAKPKVRRDWPMGSYLRYMEGPGWHEPTHSSIYIQDPAKHRLMTEVTNPIAGPAGSSASPDSGLVHLQYNSPINLYSADNVKNSLGVTQGQGRGVSPAGGAASPISLDITQSPTYQFLQTERVADKQRSASPKFSPVTGQASRGPVQSPYFKSLSHSLNVSDY